MLSQCSHTQSISGLAIVSALILIVSPLSCSLGFPDQNDIESIRQIVDAGFREKYAVAESLSMDLQNRYPDHPLGYVMHAAMLQSQMLDDEHFDYQDDFYALIKLVERKCRSLLKNSPDDAWVLYCLGLAHGSKAVYDSRAGSKWSAIKHGIRSKQAFTRCIEADGGFVDAYVGLGSYHYWRTAKTSVINWLPFIQDDKDEGIHELLLAADSALFSADLARNSLIWIFMDMKDYESAESLSVEMQNKYPEGRKFLWGIAYSRLRQGNYLGAEATVAELIVRIDSTRNNNGFNVVECRHLLARIYQDTEQYAKCLEQCRLAQELEIEESVLERLRKTFSEIKALERRAKRALSRRMGSI